MDPLFLSTVALIAGALLLSLLAGGPALWRGLRRRRKGRRHD